jgi:hypothetical protein
VTGLVTRNLGKIGFAQVYGLAFWGGSVYGFTEGGELFEVTNVTPLTSARIIIPGVPTGLQFYGAGSATSAPILPR